ncbi:MAG: hypothetical protein EAZ62_02980 [Sphingobacteriia bacterium]|nr:MAG: hypothetical protein EAZ62_02980 [Sphingobacteriia bacterium]
MYVYNDCSQALHKAIDKAIQEDIELKDKLETIRRSVAQLDKLQLKSPSQQSIKAILAYAKSNK